jgi:L-aspartate oxidase
VLRDAERLERASEVVEAVLTRASADTVADHELRNLATVGRAAVDAAMRREESRGSHHRDDHPQTDPAFAHRIVFA